MVCYVRSKAPKLGTARRSLFATLHKDKAQVVADVALSNDKDVNVCFNFLVVEMLLILLCSYGLICLYLRITQLSAGPVLHDVKEVVWGKR